MLVSSVNTANIYTSESVNKDFAASTLAQFNRLAQNSSSDIQAKHLVIIKNAEDAMNVEGLDPETLKFFEGDGAIAYGLFAKNADTIFIMEDNHGRKVEKYEGDIFAQGADTLTHEFGHLLDDGASYSKTFSNAYYKDLKNIERRLQENSDETIADSDMTIKEAVQYFKHYMEGADFSDGISKEDVTKQGLRENFAESFSVIFDFQKSKVNDIYENLFENSVNAVGKVFLA